MTLAVVVSGSRRTEHRPASDYDGLFGVYLAPFVAVGGSVFVGGAVGVDTLASRWLVRHTAARLKVVVPGTVGDQPGEAREVIAAARARPSLFELTELRHPSFPSAAAYHARNRWMVDRAGLLVAFPCGDDPKSGTAYTINYAAERGLPRLIVPI